MTRKYDESLAAIQEMQQAGTAVYKVEDMEFGRRLAMERELELPPAEGGKIPGSWINAVWDESGALVLYPTLLGIKGASRRRATYWSALTIYYLLGNSREYRDEPGSEAYGKGRDRAVLEFESVSRCTGEEGIHDCCNGCVCQPHSTRETRPRPYPFLHCLQASAILHVHSGRTRVSLSSHPDQTRP